MRVNKIEVGELRCNCYLLEQNGEALLVDPGDELEKIEKFIEGKNVIGILLTHGHFDHVGCVDYLIDKYHYPLYDYNSIKEGMQKISTFCFEVIETLGHTLDCLTFYFKEDKIMITGDFLFFNTVGRCDLDGSNPKLMMESIEKIKKYPDDVVVYPGHGPSTILGFEKVNNPYFNGIIIE